MRTVGVAMWLAVALLVCPATRAHADDAAQAQARGEAREIIGEIRRIVSEHGVERLEPVRIGGIEQWVSIRGNDRRNPVLLMLHGGPGWVSMPTSWYFQRGWEDYFTVVQWDQRGAGMTYRHNGPEALAPTMTHARMIADTEEMVAWLRAEFDKERIFVIGHSWGSYLGLELAVRRPQWLHAYIGMGQISDAPESERRGWRFAMDHARREGNAEAVAELESIAPYAQGDAPIDLDDLMLQRKWLNRYGGMMHNRTGGHAEAALSRLSPEYDPDDLAALWAGNEFSMRHLLQEVLTLDMSRVARLETPLILFLGRHDTNVSADAAAQWYAQVQAPAKALVWFEHSAHEMMVEEPGKTLVSLVEHAWPIAERAGDVPPSDP